MEEGHCEVRNQFKGLFHECYAPYDIRYEDKASFGPKEGTQYVIFCTYDSIRLIIHYSSLSIVDNIF